MTEAEWLANSSPDSLIEHLRMLGWHRTRVGRRKLRLFACAACRRVWDLFDAEGQAGVETAERIAEGQAPPEAEKGGWSDWTDFRAAATDAARVARSSRILRAVNAGSAASGAAYSAARDRGDYGPLAKNIERAEQARALREIAGNPFRPLSTAPACLTPTVVCLAEAAYIERELPTGHLDGARLGVLADALVEAGCTNEDVLTHLRSPEPHVRGCWALDLVLAKR